MLHKFSFVVLCIISFSFFSCNRAEEKNEEVLSLPINSSSQELPKGPSNDLLIVENKFEHDSLNFELRSMLAANYYTEGFLDKAAYHFIKVYEHDNKNLTALTNLGNIYYDDKQDDKAIRFYEKALELDPKNINMRCDLATSYSNINKLKKAIQILKENIQMDNNHAQSHHNLSVILAQSGNNKEADEEMKIYQKLRAVAK